jgi:hypothetical protein
VNEPPLNRCPFEATEVFGKMSSGQGTRSPLTPAEAQFVRELFERHQLVSCPVRREKKRRDSSVGVRPTRQLTLQPVAIGAVVEVTKRLKPSI